MIVWELPVNLSEAERNAITDFSLLWGFFESRVLEANGNASRICTVVDAWHSSGILVPDLLDQELDYFRQRYNANGRFTHHFDNLLLRPPDRETMVRGVLNGTEY